MKEEVWAILFKRCIQVVGGNGSWLNRSWKIDKVGESFVEGTIKKQRIAAAHGARGIKLINSTRRI